MEAPYSMLLGMTIGFFIIACMEYATVRRFFPENSNHYRSLLKFFVGSRELILANAFYMLGLYVHNFVFWSTDMHMVAADSFVCAQSYDIAAFIAMLTNISSTIIFTVGVEMRFHSRYRAYTEAVVGGRASDIRLAKSSMIEQIGGELGRLVRTQFIISVMIFLVCQIFLPAFGFSGLVMRIYPCLAAGFFIVFMMYAEMVFLYYFDDLKGSMAVAALFCLVTFAGSVLATQLTAIWYGLGLLLGGLAGWVAGYARLSWITRHLERHIFCRGSLLKKRKGKKPSGKVYERMENRA
jgi:uncharacterized membrane protein